jgi:hypothetical protein
VEFVDSLREAWGALGRIQTCNLLIRSWAPKGPLNSGNRHLQGRHQPHESALGGRLRQRHIAATRARRSIVAPPAAAWPAAGRGLSVRGLGFLGLDTGRSDGSPLKARTDLAAVSPSDWLRLASTSWMCRPSWPCGLGCWPLATDANPSPPPRHSVAHFVPASTPRCRGGRRGNHELDPALAGGA